MEVLEVRMSRYLHVAQFLPGQPAQPLPEEEGAYPLPPATWWQERDISLRVLPEPHCGQGGISCWEAISSNSCLQALQKYS